MLRVKCIIPVLLARRVSRGYICKDIIHMTNMNNLPAHGPAGNPRAHSVMTTEPARGHFGLPMAMHTIPSPTRSPAISEKAAKQIINRHRHEIQKVRTTPPACILCIEKASCWLSQPTPDISFHFSSRMLQCLFFLFHFRTSV